jgi:hypothetical protein
MGSRKCMKIKQMSNSGDSFQNGKVQMKSPPPLCFRNDLIPKGLGGFGR